MQAIKAKKKDAEAVKRLMLEHNLFEKMVSAFKDREYVYLPLVQLNPASTLSVDNIKKKFAVEVVNKVMKPVEVNKSYKELLAGNLTEKEIEILPSSFDVIGKILIIEVPKKLVKKEKIIANALLKAYSNIETVVKKAGKFTGEFRTRKVKVLAGKKNKEAEYKENNITLKLNIEDVYFSSRLGTERKRINSLVKPGEDILIMFSGCGPYVFNIAKNTKANFVYGIEMNPIAHKYAVENKAINRANNCHLICGDVKRIIPEFYRHIIGLKSSIITKELSNKLAPKPNIIEFHLFEDDLFKNRKRLINAIEGLKKRVIEVVLHMPFTCKGERIDISKPNEDMLAVIDALGDICRAYNLKAIVHPTHNKYVTKDEIAAGIKRFEKYNNHFYFETIPKAVGGFYDWEGITEIGKKSGIRNVCIDISHLYETYQDNKKIKDAILNIKKEFNTYFHVNDGVAAGDSIEIGKGNVDFDVLLPLVTTGVAEVINKNELTGDEMLRSFEALKKFRGKTFDRIVMPLPKSAENFLKYALMVSKKGTIIHFYDFLNEKDIPKKAFEKIEKSCRKEKRKVKMLNCVKCGAYGPGIFRVCVDFEVSN